MSNNNEINNNTGSPRAVYTESKGTGVISTLIFAVLVTVLMIVIAHFKGS